jgi:superfamily II DNA or RNA helicase
MISPIVCRVGAELRMSVATMSSGELRSITDGAAYANPAHAQALRRGVAAWMLPDARLTTARQVDGDIVLPRGLTGLVRRVFGSRLQWVDERLTLEPVEFRLRRELRDHQAPRVEELVRREQAILHGVTGVGKTTMLLAAAALTRQPTIILAGGTNVLLNQWVGEVQNVCGEEAGVVGDGRFDIRPITVALWQTLRQPEILAAVRSRFGCVIGDEAHDLTGEHAFSVLSALEAKFRFLATGTIPNDHRGVLLRHLGGDHVVRIGYGELTEKGFLCTPRYRVVESTFTCVDDADFVALATAVTNDATRNALITATAVEACRGGRLTLVLTGRVLHAHHIGADLAANGVRVGVLAGDVKGSDRTKILAAARCGGIDVLVATTLADQGLDLPSLERLILAFPSRSEVRLLQRIGRVLRVHKGKSDPEVIDIVDPHVGLLAHQARIRASIFRRTWGSGCQRAA